MILREVGLRMSDPVTFRAVADAPEVQPDLTTDEESARLELNALIRDGAASRMLGFLEKTLNLQASAEGRSGPGNYLFSSDSPRPTFDRRPRSGDAL